MQSAQLNPLLNPLPLPSTILLYSSQVRAKQLFQATHKETKMQNHYNTFVWAQRLQQRQILVIIISSL